MRRMVLFTYLRASLSAKTSPRANTLSASRISRRCRIPSARRTCCTQFKVYNEWKKSLFIFMWLDQNWEQDRHQSETSIAKNPQPTFWSRQKKHTHVFTPTGERTYTVFAPDDEAFDALIAQEGDTRIIDHKHPLTGEKWFPCLILVFQSHLLSWRKGRIVALKHEKKLSLSFFVPFVNFLHVQLSDGNRFF